MLLYTPLIIAFVLCFVASFVYILKRDDMAALGYLTLFIYTVFTQIGYLYYPELSVRGHVYYGEEAFVPYWLFTFLSFAVSFILFVILHGWLPSTSRAALRPAPRRSPVLFHFIVITLTLVLGVGYVLLRSEMRYSLSEERIAGAVRILLPGFRLYGLVVLILWARWRDRQFSGPHRRGTLIILLAAMSLYVTVFVGVGSRSDLLYLGIALAFYELHPVSRALRVHRRRILVIALASIPVLYLMLTIEYVRGRSDVITVGLVARQLADYDNVLATNGIVADQIIGMDYYWPSHLLVTAMDAGYINPLEVAESNSANLVVGLKQPYLTETLAKMANPSEVDRMRGYAFWLFTEGWVAAGWLGVLYNGIVWNVMMLLWRRLTTTNVSTMNRVLVALAALLIPSSMRAQSSMGLKSMWMLFLPAAILAVLASPWRLLAISSRFPKRRAATTGRDLSVNTIPLKQRVVGI